ncbi:hypothetical protein COLO4_01146 [Corchorus olitorius]|uniref:Uncharacterized protein n=1 Tax=Corchorus olitorius TaxID=93759 RepID=A0A1R3L323_9ROSI|nr:hypothetical protein COLO4_01146 [Corchorus olitorius]
MLTCSSSPGALTRFTKAWSSCSLPTKPSSVTHSVNHPFLAVPEHACLAAQYECFWRRCPDSHYALSLERPFDDCGGLPVVGSIGPLLAFSNPRAPAPYAAMNQSYLGKNRLRKDVL